MYITCEKCEYNHDYVCHFYVMNRGNEIDMPCYREKELMKGAVDNFLQALFSTEDKLVKESINAVLDKIRAEIMGLTDGDTPERIWNVDVLEIIDKYKAKSEVSDADSD